MKPILFADCELLGFKKEFLNDEVARDEYGFDDFAMTLELDDRFSLHWEWRNKTVTLFDEPSNAGVGHYKGIKNPVMITDYNELTSFLEIFKQKTLLDAINYINTPKVCDNKEEQNTIKKEVVSELIKFTDGKYMIYLQKEGNKIRILNEFKNEIFIFQNPEISKKVCELIIYALNCE
jgi:hypothetical protein